MKTHKPLFLAFTTQKGGVGKSIFTTLTASYLHYNCGVNVVVVDCDKGQYSLYRMRERDLKIIESDSLHKERFYLQYERIAKSAYPILCSPAKDAIEVAENYIQNCSTKVDLVLFDLPGTVHSEGVMECVAGLDHIFIPITADPLTLESSLAFALTVKEYLLDDSQQQLKSLYLFWNMVVTTERTALYDDYTKIIKELELPILNTSIPETVRYKKELKKGKKEVFRSTLFPISPSMLKGSRFDELVSEILDVIKIIPDYGKE